MKRKSLIPLFCVVFGAVGGFSMILTVLNILILSWNIPFYDRTMILGSLLAMYPLGQFLFGPVFGALSDHYGRKPMLLIVLAGCITGYIVTSLAFIFELFPLLYVSLFITGASDSTFVLSQSIIADVSSNKERATYFGYLYALFAFAWIFGPLMAAELIRMGVAIPFLAITVYLILLFFWVGIHFQETFIFEPEHKLQLKESLTTFFKVFTEKGIRKFYLVNALLYLAMYIFYRTYPMIVVQAFHFDIETLDELISFLAFPAIFANVLVIKPLSKKLPSLTITFIFSLLITLSLLVIYFPSTSFSVWITLAIITFVMAIVLTASTAFISEYTPPEYQGKAMGNNLSIFFLSEALSAALGGVLVAIYLFLPILLAAVLSLLAAILLIPHLKRT